LTATLILQEIVMTDMTKADFVGTPGPWVVIKADRGFIISANYGAYDVSVVRNVGNQDNEANARLIAAAPDLLEACKAVVKFWDSITEEDCVNNIHVQARAAIAKATGQ